MCNNIIPKIYVACLAAYNNGYLHGEWIDATQDVDAIYSDIQKILASSPIPDAEEWAIHDYEGFYAMQISEDEGIESVSVKAQFILEHGEVGATLAQYYDYNLDEAKEAIENNYQGEWNSELEFAIELFDDCYTHNLPENLCHYIDYEKFSRDIFFSDYMSIEANNKVHVISCY